MIAPDDPTIPVPAISPADLAPRAARAGVMRGEANAYERDPFRMGETPEHLLEPIRRLRRNAAWRMAWKVFFRGSLVVIGAWLLAQALDREPPTAMTIEVATPAVSPGSDLKLRITPHRRRVCKGRSELRVWDRAGNVINRSETDWAFPTGGTEDHEPFIRALRILSDAVLSQEHEDGSFAPDARARVERLFYCNPVQELLHWPVVEISPDLQFAIVPRVKP